MASSSTSGVPKAVPVKLSTIPGHLSNLISKGEALPYFPSQGHVKNFGWLAGLVYAMTLDMREYAQRWNYFFCLFYAKHMKDLWWSFDSLSALIELWHPSTHTFIFHDLEASVLVEEVEMMFGWLGLSYDPRVASEPWEEILVVIVQDKREVCRMTSHHEILVDRLACWLRENFRKIGGERSSKGLLLCMGGVFFFPTIGDVLEYKYVKSVSLLWHGQSIAPAVLAHLYSSLSSMSMGGRSRGSLFVLQLWLEMHVKFDCADELQTTSRIFQRSALYPRRAWYEPEEYVKCLTADLKGRAAWRNFLSSLTKEDFIGRPIIMKQVDVIRPSSKKWKELRLVGSTEAVLYQPHRCQPQLGLPRQVPRETAVAHMIVSADDAAYIQRKLKIWRRQTETGHGALIASEDSEVLKEYEAYIAEIRPDISSFFLGRSA